MSRVSLGAIGGMLALLAAVAWSIAWPDRDLGPRSKKPALALLTSSLSTLLLSEVSWCGTPFTGAPSA